MKNPALMRYRCFKIIFVFLLILSLIPRAYADDMWTKLGRGITNVGTGYYEIINQTAKAGKTQPWLVASMTGLTKGLVMGTVRTGAGVIEVATFPIPIPLKYKPIMKPSYVVPTAYEPVEKWPDWGEGNRRL